MNSRLEEVRRRELSEPVGLFYLSFADESGFLGAAIVEAHGPVTAVRRCHQLGINPGGEVMTMKCPGPVLPELMDRLLSKRELAYAFGDLVSTKDGCDAR